MNNDLTTLLKTLNLQKSRLGVGKSLGQQIWLHKSTLPALEIPHKQEILSSMDNDYCIVRISKNPNAYQLSSCPDFNTSREPLIHAQKSFVIVNGKANLSKTTCYSSDNGLIFHHKHLFVRPDYKGFSVEEAIKWSLTWKAEIGICRKTSGSIGRIRQWNDVLTQLKLPLDHDL
jgi:hypothetical protein